MSDTPSSPSLGQLSAIKLALMAQKVRAQSEAVLRADPIAIVGMGCRFPGGADSPEAFWQLLVDGVDAVRPVPADRWDVQAVYDADPSVPGKSIAREGGFLERIDGFDAAYFNILPREAERMDPQQRLFLEVAMEALDDAGFTRDKLRGSRAGAFVASYHNDYQLLEYRDPEAIDARTLTGTVHSVLVNRLSYLLDLRGPSVSVDTACSSSLVAIHLACQSLRHGESDIALAGGVSLMVTPDLMVSLSKVGFMAPDGRCKTFDDSADGFGRGEGCGVIVLKRLSDAVADGDRVLAVVRGSAVNQDGHSTLLAAPNGLAQQDLIREALAAAQLEPGRIGFIEAHGTGTPLGDPIEVEALAATVGRADVGGGTCWLGAAKANLAHMEAAAGVAGVIKTVLAMRHEAIPPQIHFKSLNKHLAGRHAPGRAHDAHALAARARTRCAGTSSFGVGGTNAHVVLEEAPRLGAAPQAPAGQGTHLLHLSAQSGPALRELARSWAGFLPQPGLADRPLLHRGRAPLRAGPPPGGAGPRPRGTARPARGLRARRRSARRLPGPRGARRRAAPGLRLQRPGPAVVRHGPRAVGAGTGVSRAHGRMRGADPRGHRLVAAGRAVRGRSGVAPAPDRGGSARAVRHPGVAGRALGRLGRAPRRSGRPQRGRNRRAAGGRCAQPGRGRARGLPARPRDAAGHRPRPHGRRRLQRRRGRGPAGALRRAALARGPERAAQRGALRRAAALDEALNALASRGVHHRLLPVNYAFHSAQMAPLQRELVARLGEVASSPAAVPVYSTVTGAAAPRQRFDADYFGRNVREPVRLQAAIEALSDDGFNAFLEIGPHPVLSGALGDTLQARGRAATVAASLRRGKPERDTLLASAAARVVGHTLDTEALLGGPGEVVDLPRYPWQRQRYWLRPTPVAAAAPARPSGAHPLLGARLPLAATSDRVYQARWTVDSAGALRDHRIGGRLLMPGAAMLETLHAAWRAEAGAGSLEAFAVDRPLPLPDAGELAWQVVVRDGAAGAVLELFQAIDAAPGWQRVCSAIGRREAAPSPGAAPAPMEGAAVDRAAFYQRFDSLGVAFGPGFRGVQVLAAGDGWARGELALPPELSHEAPRFGLHPALLDAALQLCAAAASAGSAGLPTQLWVPMGVERFALWRPGLARLRASATLRAEPAPGAEAFAADLRLDDEAGEPVAFITGARFARADARRLAGDAPDEVCTRRAGSRRPPAPCPPSVPPTAPGCC
ncbi:beta-ketoacyl synthase N-terminal-like domain-containing protein [Hydrogenophaga sp. SNF1]|nr:beta-ketoacyl synthase N-terminal-like domain-containing protein [Hydrogenophaga sp. SNF1]WQB85543.1 beta-ketoacyl synthase N-terminal-like domain-containing protein [Hydrogenophaga sp. SNF1]